jgi:hypothetical protein
MGFDYRLLTATETRVTNTNCRTPTIVGPQPKSFIIGWNRMKVNSLRSENLQFALNRQVAFPDTLVLETWFGLKSSFEKQEFADS